MGEFNRERLCISVIACKGFIMLYLKLEYNGLILRIFGKDIAGLWAV